MFIQTEDTPNPQSMKFRPGQPVLGEGALGQDYPSAEAAARAPLARSLFEIDGVEGVFLGADFITVTKSEGVEWMHVKPAILGAIADGLLAGLGGQEEGAAPSSAPATSLDDYEGEDREVVEQIIELIDTRVRRRWRRMAATSSSSITSRAPASSSFRSTARVRVARHRR